MIEDFTNTERKLNGLIDMANSYNSTASGERLFVFPKITYTTAIVKEGDYDKANKLQSKGFEFLKELKNGIYREPK